jgi:hypothetical protein
MVGTAEYHEQSKSLNVFQNVVAENLGTMTALPPDPYTSINTICHVHTALY